MTSIPVPALEAPPDEPSGTKIGAVVIAFALGTAVSIGLGRPPSTNERLRRVRAAAHTVGPWGQHRRVSSGAAAKAALASVVLALAILQAVTAMGLYGRSGGLGWGRAPLVGAPGGPDFGTCQCSACMPWASRPTTVG